MKLRMEMRMRKLMGSFGEDSKSDFKKHAVHDDIIDMFIYFIPFIFWIIFILSFFIFPYNNNPLPNSI